MTIKQFPTVHRSIENIFLKRNRHCTRDQLHWRGDSRMEWMCKHGTGHTVFSPRDNDFMHGCCMEGCCSSLVTFSIKFNDRVRQ